ncbi:hypothetical protein BDV28DRAFT_137606 [Aspergillus coremiiformis]|uniref:Inner centromere protein ARK-binding domain-containing protein n=1 Tax=Aspergillus coremiiformis TaxID=138285 RepID=A0A5N6Z2L3_9EURO|nr:hypothetical protein BDV28DRAFT_137606 [Aspergillus coremiiformis]
MAASGARAQKPVGSAAWISTEKENFTNLVNQEMEEVEYPVRHEMDWLNEHMAEIFSSNQFNFTEAFKTPGKLRGKTPRTARKRDPNENRVPLSEIFSTSHNRVEDKVASPTIHRSPTKPTPAPAAATPTKPKNITESAPRLEYPNLTQNLNSHTTYNTDSGYHGMPDEDEDQEDDDVVLTQVQPESQASTQPVDSQPIPIDVQEHRSSISRRTTGASFHSAQEDVQQRDNTEPMQVDPAPKETTEEHTPKPQPEPEVQPEVQSEAQSGAGPNEEHNAEPESKEPTPEPQPAEQKEPAEEPEDQLTKDTKSSPVKTPAPQPSEPSQDKDGATDGMALDGNIDEIGSPSDGSTPERPPIRKSSLSFASLPAREPLVKKSLGGSRVSRTSHVDIAKINAGGSSYLGRQTGGHRTTQTAVDEFPASGEKMDIDDNKESAQDDTDAETRASKLHSKSSTQRLHEKISMLGKLQPSRPTKSIPSVPGLSTQVTYPELPSSKVDAKPETTSQKPRATPAPEPMEAENEDWIRPLGSPSKANFPRSQADAEKRSGAGHVPDHETASAPKESATRDEAARSSAKQDLEMVLGKYSTPTYSSPQRPGQQTASTSHVESHVSTTPVGSPAQDGLVSASKFRLQSIVRSAKGLFSNTGGVVAARMEPSSPDELRVQRSGRVNPDAAGRKMMQPTRSPSPPRQEGRRTRSSTEREERRKRKELEDRQREEEQAEAARQQEKEKQRAAQLKTAQEKLTAENESRDAPVSSPQKMPQPQKHSSREPEPNYEASSKRTARPSVSQQPTRHNDRRPAKPTREALQKPKPQPVSIRVGSALSRQIPLASSAVSGVESSAPVPTPASASKPPGLRKKASNSSLHTASSNSSFKSSVSSQTQRKAQLASERKREQEERRREEQRRELERKRAAQQEDARRQEMRSRAETERRERLATDDPKKAAQMQAIEKRRLENARRLERQGSQQPEMHATLPPERPASQAARPASRLGSMQPYSRTINPPQPNPAKPPKRGLDEESQRSAAPKPGAMQPSGEAKRRRTEDEHNPVMRPTMAPPIRQSNIRKESIIRKEPTKPSLYGHAQSTMAHQSGSSIFKTAQPQRPAHPMDMAKYASGKIPFAEPSNAPPQSATHKTPVASSSSHKAAHKPSPNYPNGENIHLPEIATDSEDEDSDAEMLPVPKWAQPRELESLLRQQEGLEADSIFGPIAPFSLEETFKADKKIKKFRERTSSANWVGTDALTQEEIRRDLAERQRLRLNGGWSFN